MTIAEGYAALLAAWLMAAEEWRAPILWLVRLNGLADRQRISRCMAATGPITDWQVSAGHLEKRAAAIEC